MLHAVIIAWKTSGGGGPPRCASAARSSRHSMSAVSACSAAPHATSSEPHTAGVASNPAPAMRQRTDSTPSKSLP
jgi:hypothetical protein